MAATIEIKYYNSFWLKKMPELTVVSSLNTEGTAPLTRTITVQSNAGVNTITVNGGVTDAINIGQDISYTVSNESYTNTIIYRVNTDPYGATILTLYNNTTVIIPVGTIITFGKITNPVWLPSVYSSSSYDWYI